MSNSLYVPSPKSNVGQKTQPSPNYNQPMLSSVYSTLPSASFAHSLDQGINPQTQHFDSDIITAGDYEISLPYDGPPITFWNNAQTANGASDWPWSQRPWIALVEKELPFASRTVDLSNKSKDFKTMYKTIHPDHQAGAKVPILEVGFPGEKDYVQLVESSVCTKYIATAWPYRGADLLPAWPGL